MVGNSAKPIRVAIVDDQAIVRFGLRLFLEAQEGIVCAGEANDRASAMTLAAEQQPDIILLDLDLGNERGSAFVREVLEAAPANAKVIVLTGVRDVALIRQAVDNGAMGVVRKDSEADVLVRAIHRVSEGQTWVDDDLATALTSSRSDEEAASRIAQLSKRELEVIRVLAEALSNKEIADVLYISETTVRHHLTSIFAKLGVTDRLGLVVYAIKHRIVEQPKPDSEKGPGR